ncbi:MAG: glycosyltransferase family 2 protein, partial [Terriglobales bacterium]
MPTRNRPERLYKCLTSLAQCAQQFERRIRFVVADDSESEESQQQNIQALEKVRQNFSVEIEYAGMKQKEQFAAALAKQADVPYSVAEFAVLNPENCPISTGANRNVLLLSTIGGLALQADDD